MPTSGGMCLHRALVALRDHYSVSRMAPASRLVICKRYAVLGVVLRGSVGVGVGLYATCEGHDSWLDVIPRYQSFRVAWPEDAPALAIGSVRLSLAGPGPGKERCGPGV